MPNHSKLSKALIERICARLAEGEPMTRICKGADMPTARTVNTWQREHQWVGDAIKAAREIGFDAIAESCLAIADDSTFDYTSEDENGKTVIRLNTENIQRSKLRVWTRLQLLAKWDPKRYGERVQHANDPTNPLPAPQFIIQPVKPVSDDA